MKKGGRSLPSLSTSNIRNAAIVLLVFVFLLYYWDFASPKQPNVPVPLRSPPPQKAIRQILVLGMHHSATSLISRFMVAMNCWAGRQDELLFHADPRLAKFKFWERRDVIRLNQNLLFAGTPRPLQGPKWVGFQYDEKNLANKSILPQFHKIASKIITNLNRHPLWVTKEPRMCLTMNLWRKHLESQFFCVLVYRHPLEVANRLSRYGGLSLQNWVDVWENYTIGALNGCAGMPKAIISQTDFGQRPYDALKKLYEDMISYNVSGVLPPSKLDVEEYLTPVTVQRLGSGLDASAKYEKVPIEAFEYKMLSLTQKCLAKLFEMGKPFEWSEWQHKCATIVSREDFTPTESQLIRWTTIIDAGGGQHIEERKEADEHNGHDPNEEIEDEGSETE